MNVADREAMRIFELADANRITAVMRRVAQQVLMIQAERTPRSKTDMTPVEFKLKDGAEVEVHGRELQIAVLHCAGLLNKEMADKLCIDHKTVATYKYRLKTKLNCEGCSDVAFYLAIKDAGLC